LEAPLFVYTFLFLTVYFEMKHFVMGWNRTKIPVLRTWWTDRSTGLLRIAAVFLAALALLKLGDELRNGSSMPPWLP